MKIKIEFGQKEFDAFKGFNDMIEGKVNMISKLFGGRAVEKAQAVAGAAVESFEKTAQDGQYSIAVSVREDWVCKVTGLVKDVYEDTFDLIASIVPACMVWGYRIKKSHVQLEEAIEELCTYQIEDKSKTSGATSEQQVQATSVVTE